MTVSHLQHYYYNYKAVVMNERELTSSVLEDTSNIADIPSSVEEPNKVSKSPGNGRSCNRILVMTDFLIYQEIFFMQLTIFLLCS